MNLGFKNIACLALLLCNFFIVKSYAQTFIITSPDGKLELSVSLNNSLNYSLNVSGQAVLVDSKAELTIEGVDSSKKIISVKRNSVHRILNPHVQQKSKDVVEHYNEISLQFDNKQSVTFRIFDQGMAYRFSTQKIGTLVVNSELALFNFDNDHQVLFPEEKSFISHNERLYLPKLLSEISSKQFASLPLLIDVMHSNKTNTKVVITETGLRDYPGMWLKGSDKTALSALFPKQVLKSELKEKSDRNENIIKRASYLAKVEITANQAERNFPWRVIAIGKTDAELLTNELSYLLADELKIANPSWIKPGKVAWDWWNANNIYGVDFTSGINTQTYKYYIDFAAQYGLEYIVMDEGWYHLGNVLDVVPDINVKEIIDYGKSKNVDVILWVIWETLDQQLERALDTYEKWGAAGIKVDFMQRDDQAMVNYYWKVAEQAAKRHLLVDFHGSYKPAGLRRAYPNVITREGLRGLEHNKWADYITAEHNLTLPFIRMLAGPMDYTPGAMINAHSKNFNIVFDRPMSKTTRAHQVAMYVVFESPLQMLADSPSNYLKEYQSTQFISVIPTVWDETRILSAKISDHIITARRSGDEWFVGIMGNSKAHDFTVDLSFLSSGDYQMESFADGINSEKYASDYQINKQSVTRLNKVKVRLAPSGGWVARLIKVKVKVK
ncbi:glycoside hydrolase family 97 protein [Colwellia psychrerythraea]|uniref:Glycoside hydrolase 97 n=1 Tax=Colwellia psychrerythraea TaxID=28229 RepID=A0A099KNK8_COLPS|nr:glycoside hydrolase family 97 protein [Colwellia psychrerythraea]KGJ91208.1 Glycoside hydrolase 97 [Colwellia psychrerythraea]